jgi:hypothetical protein
MLYLDKVNVSYLTRTISLIFSVVVNRRKRIYVYEALTIKKIIKKAWAVTITLYSWWSPCKNCTPGEDNSNLIITEKAVPIIPENTANIR